MEPRLNRLVALGVLALALAMAGCSFVPSLREQSHFAAGSALTRLSAAVESTVRFKNPPSELTDDELLRLSTAHDPALLQALAGYRVSVLRDEGHALLLVCEPGKDEAVFEDAGCTAALDRHHWQREPAPSCRFSLRTSETCPP